MFEKEQRIAERAQLLLNENLTSEEWKNAYAHLALDYADLLSDMKFLTKISDRLHNKLSLINEQAIKHSTELENAKRMIAIQNEELKKKISQRTSDVRNAYSQLLATHSELDQFVYRASHDLKGPIARLLGLCQVANIEVTMLRIPYIPLNYHIWETPVYMYGTLQSYNYNYYSFNII